MRPCNSCPFRKGTKNFGSPDWLIDVMKGLMIESLDHSCHKTDPKADGYVGHKVGKLSICMGAVAMMKNRNTCYDSRIIHALVKGEIDFAAVDTSEVFDDPRDFIRHHLAQINKEALSPGGES